MARRGYPTDLTDAQWTWIDRYFRSRRKGGRPRQTDLRGVVDAILYLLRTGCQWRIRPSDLPPRGTVWWYFRRWRLDGVWTRLHRALHRAARLKAGRRADPTGVIMDAQSVKTTERGAFAASMATSA
jgi:putative transposase